MSISDVLDELGIGKTLSRIDLNHKIVITELGIIKNSIANIPAALTKANTDVRDASYAVQIQGIQDHLLCIELAIDNDAANCEGASHFNSIKAKAHLESAQFSLTQAQKLLEASETT